MMKMNIKKFAVIGMMLILGSGFAMCENDGAEILIIPKKREELDKIIIPVVSLKSSTIIEAINFAWARAVELDILHLKREDKGVSISVRFPSVVYPKSIYTSRTLEDPDKIKISYQAKEISLTVLLIEIAKRSGFDLYTTSVGVVFCPPASSPFPNSFSKEGKVLENLYRVDGVRPK